MHKKNSAICTSIVKVCLDARQQSGKGNVRFACGSATKVEANNPNSRLRSVSYETHRELMGSFFIQMLHCSSRRSSGSISLGSIFAIRTKRKFRVKRIVTNRVQ